MDCVSLLSRIHSAIFCLAIALLLFSSCDNPSTSADRINPLDPASGNYTHGVIGEFQVVVQPSGNIILQWSESADIKSGYLIEKSLNDTLSFETLAAVPKNTTSYIDTTGIVRNDMYYRISSFIGTPGSKVTVEQTKTIKPDIAPDPSFSAIFNEITKKNEVSWKINKPFIERIEISVYQNNPDNVIFSTTTDPSDSLIEDDLDGIEFSDRVYSLKGYLSDKNENELVLDEQFRFDASRMLSPENLQVEIVTEAEVQLRWSNRSFFEEKLNVYKRNTDDQMELVTSLEPGTTEFTDRSILHPLNRYEVTAAADDLESEATISENEFIWETEPRVSLTGSNTDPGAIQLSVDVSPRSKVEELILMRKSTMDQTYEEIDRFGPEITHYTDRDADQNKQYLYKLHTISTQKWSEGEEAHDIEIAYMDTYQRARSYNHNDIDFPSLHHMEIYDDRYLVAVPQLPIFDRILQVTLIDLETNTRYSIKLPEPESFSAFAVHAPNETFIVGSSNLIYEYTFPDGELIREKQVVPVSQLGRNFPPRFFKFDEHYESIYANSSLGSIVKLDYETLNFEIFRQGGGSSRFFNKELALSNERNLVVTNDVVNYVHDTFTGEEVATFGPRILENSTTEMFFSNDHEYFVQLRYPERLETYRTDHWTGFHTKRLGFKTGIDLRPSADHQVGGVDGNNIVIYDFVNRSYNTFLKTNKDFYKIKFINKNSFVIGTSDAQLEIWENQLRPEWTLFDFDN